MNNLHRVTQEVVKVKEALLVVENSLKEMEEASTPIPISPKYCLTAQYVVVGDRVLYRIVALINFGDVKKGDKGGYIETEDNLSHVGLAWVYGDAKVFGNARAFDNATVRDKAQVFGNAEVRGNAWVSGNARVYGYAKVYNNAHVFGNAWVSGNAMVYDCADVYGNARVYGDTTVFGRARVFGDAAVRGVACVVKGIVSGNTTVSC